MSKSADAIAARQQVYKQLSARFPPEAIAWVKLIRWDPACKIPLDEFDTADETSWAAYRSPDHVAREVQQYKDGENDPIVGVIGPDGRILIIDGHHRYLAREKMNKSTVKTYLGHVPRDEGPWLYTHMSQKGGDSG